MTQRLYYEDSHIRTFEATVLSCTQAESGWHVVLDRTAFFPAGGGQLADRGTLGAANVLDVYLAGDGIVHVTNAPLAPGSTVCGTLDWDTRFRRMQAHSAEHIVSGLAHRLHGCENVGFACGDGEATLDFDRELTADEVAVLERAANGAVFANVPVHTFFPEPGALPSYDYRSKLELTENVRLVQIGDYDLCACCAPHVAATGEIGAIRLDGLMRHRGGVRLHLVAGWRAYEDARQDFENARRISGRLSAPREATADAVERFMAELQDVKTALTAKKRELTACRAAALTATDGSLCLFDSETDAAAARELVNAGVPLCGGACGVFMGTDAAGYRYIIGSRTLDLRKEAARINAALSGRGGGKSAMIEGSCRASRAEIEAFFAQLH